MQEKVAPRQVVALPGWARTFTSLQYREYLLFWSGSFACNTGYWMRLLAQGWLVLELSNSAFLLGLASFALQIPILLLGLVGGYAADALDRRKLTLAAVSLSGLSVLLVAVLTSTGLINVWLIIAISGLSGLAQAFEMPVRQSTAPMLVPQEDLMNAIALNASAWQVTRVFGPALAGALVALIGVAGCLYVAAATYLIMITNLMLMKPLAAQQRMNGSMLESIGEGLAYIKSSPSIATLILMEAAPALFALPYQMLMPIFARDVFGRGALELGWLNSATGLGAAVGTLTVASLGDFRRRGLSLLLAAIGLGVALVLFGINNSFSLALLLMVGVGCGHMTFLSLTNTLVQSITKDEFRGRVMSMYSMANSGLAPVGQLAAGATAGMFGAPATLIAGGVVLSLASLGVVFGRPSIRRL